MEKVRILFVCLGNICRSPMAEGLFIFKIEQEGIQHLFEVDSAGTGNYHVGELPDSRMRRTARQNGLELVTRARQISKDDLYIYDHILAMDDSNYRNILALTSERNFPARLELMRSYDADGVGKDVPDPYFGDDQGFQEVFDILDRSVTAFLNAVKTQRNI